MLCAGRGRRRGRAGRVQHGERVAQHEPGNGAKRAALFALSEFAAGQARVDGEAPALHLLVVPHVAAAHEARCASRRHGRRHRVPLRRGNQLAAREAPAEAVKVARPHEGAVDLERAAELRKRPQHALVARRQCVRLGEQRALRRLAAVAPARLSGDVPLGLRPGVDRLPEGVLHALRGALVERRVGVRRRRHVRRGARLRDGLGCATHALRELERMAQVLGLILDDRLLPRVRVRGADRRAASPPRRRQCAARRVRRAGREHQARLPRLCAGGEPVPVPGTRRGAQPKLRRGRVALDADEPLARRQRGRGVVHVERHGRLVGRRIRRTAPGHVDRRGAVLGGRRTRVGERDCALKELASKVRWLLGRHRHHDGRCVRIARHRLRHGSHGAWGRPVEAIAPEQVEAMEVDTV